MAELTRAEGVRGRRRGCGVGRTGQGMKGRGRLTLPGSSVFQKVVSYSSWSGDRVATGDARLGMAVVEDTTTLRRASGPIVGTMNAPPEPTKRVRANATRLICVWSKRRLVSARRKA